MKQIITHISSLYIIFCSFSSISPLFVTQWKISHYQTVLTLLLLHLVSLNCLILFYYFSISFFHYFIYFFCLFLFLALPNFIRIYSHAKFVFHIALLISVFLWLLISITCSHFLSLFSFARMISDYPFTRN